MAIIAIPAAPLDLERGHETVELGDGRRVIIEPVHADDGGAEQAFVTALSAASRYRRFHVGIRELPEALLQRLTEVDQDQHVAIVARSDDDTRRIVADARYVRSSDPREAEFAIAVADEWQHAGLGRALLARLMAHARARGIVRVVGDVLWDNQPMIGMVRHLGGRFAANGSGAGVHKAVFELG